MNQLFYNIAGGIVHQIRREKRTVKRIVTAQMPSLLFRCFSLFLPHLRTLAQEKRSQNCLRFRTGGTSLCLYPLLSRNIIFSPALTMAARAKKTKILAKRFAHAISHPASRAFSYGTYASPVRSQKREKRLCSQGGYQRALSGYFEHAYVY